MVNEYFEDIRGLKFFMQLKNNQNKWDKQVKRNQSATTRIKSIYHEQNPSMPVPITSMNKHYKQMSKLKAEGKLVNQWVR